MIKRFDALVLAGAVLLAALAPIADRASAQSPDRIRVGTGPDDPSAPLVYADRTGLFKKAGLEVDLQRLDGSAAIGAALAGGSLDIAKASTVSAVTAIAKGLPFTIISSIADYTTDNPSTALIVLANSPIKVAKDLAGRTLATVTLKDQNAISTSAWLDQHGVDWKAINYVEIPASATLAALEQGRVVGATVYEPNLSADLATGKVRVLGYPHDAIAKHFPYGILIANSAWASSHTQLIARFLRVVQQSSSYALASHRSRGGADGRAVHRH